MGESVEVADEQFRGDEVLAVAAGIRHIGGFKAERREHLAHLRLVVQREDKPALYASQKLGQNGKVLQAKQPFPVVILSVPIGRIDIKERRRLVVPFDDLIIVSQGPKNFQPNFSR